MNIRRYQRNAVDAVARARSSVGRALITMPTGTGKTVTFAKIIQEGFESGQTTRAVVLAHRGELLDQARDKIARIVPGINIGIEAANRRAGPMDDVVIASVQTIGREGSARLDALRGVDQLIIDEAHHAVASGYQIVMDALGCYEGRCFTLGVTATPKRLDNKPLHGEHDAVFEEEVFRYELREAIVDGYLCDVRGFRVETKLDLSAVRSRGGEFNQSDLQQAVDTEARNRLAVGAWRNIASERKTLVFCTGIDHARHVAEMFRAEGIAAEHVDGTMKSHIRAAILKRFRRGETQILCNVEVLTEGYDEPTVGCVLMLRPTQSWGLYCQMVGRGTRVLPGIIDHLEDAGADARRAAIAQSAKPDCFVVDVVDITAKHELASVPALLGLPPRMDLQGRTITETANAMDELNAAGGGMAGRSAATFGDIRKLISEVDLLAQTVTPEIIKRSSRFAWIELPGNEYVLDCGPTADGKGKRAAYLKKDALGHYVLKRTTKYTGGEMPIEAVRADVKVSREISQAIRDSDRMLVADWPTLGRYAARDLVYKQKPATPKQLEVLKKMRINVEAHPNLTAGEASTLITQRINGGRR